MLEQLVLFYHWYHIVLHLERLILFLDAWMNQVYIQVPFSRVPRHSTRNFLDLGCS